MATVYVCEMGHEQRKTSCLMSASVSFHVKFLPHLKSSCKKKKNEVVMLYMEQLQESKSIKPIRLGTGLSQFGNAANTTEMLQAWNL